MPSGPWGRLKPVELDPLQDMGLPSKGDDRYVFILTCSLVCSGKLIIIGYSTTKHRNGTTTRLSHVSLPFAQKQVTRTQS